MESESRREFEVLVMASVLGGRSEREGERERESRKKEEPCGPYGSLARKRAEQNAQSIVGESWLRCCQSVSRR
jgi:hypothetical protein